MTELQKLQRRLKKIEILKKVEPNNSYNDWDKKIERLEGKIELEEAYQQGRADAIEECADKFADILSNVPGLCRGLCPVKCDWGTKESCKSMWKKWLLEQLKGQK